MQDSPVGTDSYVSSAPSLMLQKALIESLPFAVLLVGSDREVLCSNARFEELFGFAPQKDAIVVHSRLAALTPHPDAFTSRVDEVIHQGEAVESERIFLSDGRTMSRDFNIVTLAVDPPLMGRVWTYRDITAQVEQENAFAHTKATLETILASTLDPIYTVDREHRLTSFNNAVRHIAETHYRMPAVLGMSMTNIRAATEGPYHGHGAARDMKVSPLFERAIGGVAVREVVEIDSEIGTRFLEFALSPIRTGEEIVGVAAIVRDVTKQKQLEEDLLAVNRRYQIATQSASIYVAERDLRTLNITAVMSPTLHAKTGYTAAEIAADPDWIYSHILPEDIEPLGEQYRKAAEFGSNIEAEYGLICKDGSVLHLWHRAVVFLDPEGKPERMISTVQDITSRKKLELEHSRTSNELRTAVRRFKIAEKISHSCTYTYNYATGLIAWSDSVFEITGYYPSEIGDSTTWWNMLVLDEDRGTNIRTAAEARDQLDEFELRYRLRRKDGKLRYILVRAVVERDAAGVAVQSLGIVRDRTESVEMELDLRKTQESLQIANRRFEIANVAGGSYVYQIDLRTGGVVRSQGVESVLGYTQEELVQSPELYTSLIPVEDRERVAAAFKTSSSNPTFSVEHRIARKDGKVIYILNKGVVQRSGTGERRMVYGTIQDVTTRKEIELDLRRKEADLRLAVQRFEIAEKVGKSCTYEFDYSTARITWSNSCHTVTGYSPEEIPTEGDFYSVLVYEPDRAELREKSLAAALVSDEIEFKFRCIRKDGEVRYLGWQAILERDAEGKPARSIGVIRDITETTELEIHLRETQESLLAANRRFELAAIAGKSYVYEWNLQTGHVVRTDTVSDVLGFSPEEMPATRDAFVSNIHPEDRELTHDQFTDALANGPTFEVEHRLTRKDGRIIHVVQRGLIQRDETGAPVVLYATVQDVTARKLMELELIRERDRAEQMSRLRSAFFANMSHEIRTPLTSIIGYADLLKEDPIPNDVLDFANHIELSGRRLLDTINSILDLCQIESGGAQVAVAPINLEYHVEKAAKRLLPSAQNRGLRLSEIKSDFPIVVMAEAYALERMLQNLIGNAIKFTDRGGVTLSFGIETRGETQYGCVSIADTGIGIGEEFLKEIFTAFQQESDGLGRHYEGTGLGLAICNGLVHRLGGFIDVTSLKGQGSTFKLGLPLAPT